MIRIYIISIMPILLSFIMRTVYRGSVNGNEEIRNRYLAVCGWFIFLIFALRHYNTGADGWWYYHNWQRMSMVPVDRAISTIRAMDEEKGYLAFVWMLSHILKDAQFVFVLYGAAVSVSLCHFIKKNCDILEIGLEVFLCLGLWGFMVQGIRQGFAMCICIWSIEFVKNRKLIPFLLLIAIATLFHGSAIVFGVVYFLGLLKINFRSVLLVAVALSFSFFFVGEIFNIFNIALNDTYAIGETSRTSGGFFTALGYVAIIVFGFFTLTKTDFDTNTSLFFYMTIFGFVSFMMRYYLNSIAQRIAYYFMIGQMIILPKEIKTMKKTYQTLIIVTVFLLCMGMALYKSTYSKLNPYMFFWEY